MLSVSQVRADLLFETDHEERKTCFTQILLLSFSLNFHLKDLVSVKFYVDAVCWVYIKKRLKIYKNIGSFELIKLPINWIEKRSTVFIWRFS